MNVYLDATGAEMALSGTERLVSVLFSVRGSLQRGGFAPWPLFECAWNDGCETFTIRHNKTNQVKAPVGQINLDTTPFSDITVWRHWRIILERLDGGQTGIRVFIDGTSVWENRCGPDDPSPDEAVAAGRRDALAGNPSPDEAVAAGESASRPGNPSPDESVESVESSRRDAPAANPAENPAAKPSISFRHRSGDGHSRAAFGYILFAADRDLSLVPLREIGLEGMFDPFRMPAVDESLFAFSQLPPSPVTWTYDGDKYPFHVFPDGAIGLDPQSLPFSKNRVRNVNRFRKRENPDGFDAVVNPSCPDGKRVFATVGAAIDSLVGGQGRVFVFPGIYAESLSITAASVELVGEDPFTTVIAGFEAKTNGIARNVLVHYRGDGSGPGKFSAENIAFYNRGAEWNESIAHPEKRGAALCVENIRSGLFRNCLFIAQQDTLYLKNGTLRFENCYIEGDVDYICGGATAFFEECHLHCLLNPEGYIAAVSPVNECGPALSSAPRPKGFTFYRCFVSAHPDQKTPLHLGRGPWVNGSGLSAAEKLSTPSVCAFVECSFGTRESPFPLDAASPWLSMDRPCAGESYREFGNYENGEPAPVTAERPQLDASLSAIIQKERGLVY